jgi:CheY-like chemotaxis protein
MQASLENIADETVASDRQEPPHRTRMLVLEDAGVAAETAAAIASWMDVDVETAENDRIACIMVTISLAEERPYDVIFVDVQSAKANPAGAVEWLRQQGWRVPIVGIGADVSDEQCGQALSHGCDAFIDKPVTRAKLEAAFARLPARNRGETAAAVGKEELAAPEGAAPPLPTGEEPASELLTPAVAAKEQAAGERPARATPGEAEPIFVNNTGIKLHARVLVVEDALCMQAIVGAFLKKMEFEVDTASNGEAACEMAMQSLAKGTPYDVILMDIQMPKMTGKQAARWLRENGWQGPIVAVSGHNTAKDQAAILTAGCSNFLAKPITKATLQQALSACLKPLIQPDAAAAEGAAHAAPCGAHPR